jgi:hypothetical protein
MRRKVPFVLLGALALSLPGYALSISELDANAGLLRIGSVPPPATGGPSPIVQYIGVSIPMALPSPFFLEPNLEFFSTYYEWTGTRAVPTSYEAGPGFFTLAGILGIQGGASFPISEKISLGGSFGLDFLMRFPFDFSGDNAQRTAGMDPSLRYFFGQGRFFYPDARFFVRWQLSDWLTLLFNVRTFFPLFHLWDQESLPFIDQFMISAGLGFGIRLPKELVLF